MTTRSIFAFITLSLVVSCGEPSVAVAKIPKERLIDILGTNCSYTVFGGKFPYVLLVKKDNEMFYLIHSDDYKVVCHGHINKISMGILLSKSKGIIKVWLEEHQETPSYIKLLENQNFLSQFKGCSRDMIENIDTVSGATESSHAIKQVIIKTISAFENNVAM